MTDKTKADVGLVGLGAMGKRLARNLARQYHVQVYGKASVGNRNFLDDYGSVYLTGIFDLKKFVQSLETPRKVFLVPKAGESVDKMMEGLVPLLEKGDMIIDCGNSYYRDTIRRTQELKEQGLGFWGCGVSGGEDGALNGLSLMPGGPQQMWKNLRPIFESVAAEDAEGKPCVAYLGNDGAGHYVKMVHNGIEYGVMAMMAEMYEILSRGYGLFAPEIAKIYEDFGKRELASHLFEISVPILEKKDPKGGGYLIDKVLDKTEQGGAGYWAALDGLERGVPLPIMTEAIFSRGISVQKYQRENTAQRYEKMPPSMPHVLEEFLPHLEDAMYAAIVVAYAQGFDLLMVARKEQEWKIDLGEVCRIWQGGSVIRAKMLGVLQAIYEQDGKVPLLEVREVSKHLNEVLPSLRYVVGAAIGQGIPVPCLGAALSSFEALTNERGNANFIQALRDKFGMHGYARRDRDGTFHSKW